MSTTSEDCEHRHPRNTTLNLLSAAVSTSLRQTTHPKTQLYTSCRQTCPNPVPIKGKHTPHNISQLPHPKKLAIRLCDAAAAGSRQRNLRCLLQHSVTLAAGSIAATECCCCHRRYAAAGLAAAATATGAGQPAAAEAASIAAAQRAPVGCLQHEPTHGEQHINIQSSPGCHVVCNLVDDTHCHVSCCCRGRGVRCVDDRQQRLLQLLRLLAWLRQQAGQGVEAWGLQLRRRHAQHTCSSNKSTTRMSNTQDALT